MWFAFRILVWSMKYTCIMYLIIFKFLVAKPLFMGAGLLESQLQDIIVFRNVSVVKQILTVSLHKVCKESVLFKRKEINMYMT